MTEVVVVLQQSPSHFPSASSSSSSSSSSSTTPCAQNDDQNPSAHITKTQIVEQEEEEEEETRKERERENQGDQVSVVELLLAAFRRSLIGPCTATERGNFSSSSSRIMQIGWPSNVRHIAHVTFDRFNGFLGLPVEFEPEVPRRPPSASANVFGVSTDSMQLSFDSRGNSVPTILLMMQRHLYAHGGLEAEGIFRINADNSQEEYVRDQLNSGVIPEGVDVHSLAGLIKAWFRELPTGLLDSISPEQVMESETEEECARLVRLLPPTEAALLDWTVNLMADVAQMEHLNKMNARNVAMVFAPNMTQMADPLTALMYAVQVMNFLKTLVLKTLRERADSALDTSPEPSPAGPTDNHDDSHESSSQTTRQSNNNDDDDDRETAAEQSSTTTNSISPSFLSSIENIIVLGKNRPCEEASPSLKAGQCSASSSLKRGSKKAGILGRINSRKELVEAWR